MSIQSFQKEIALNELKGTISQWLYHLNKDLSLGRFRFALTGGLIPVNEIQGQVSTCFAMKIAWQAGIWDDWSKELRSSCVEFIRSFQRETGEFVDPWLMKETSFSIKYALKNFLGRSAWNGAKVRQIQNIRAETRQSASTLIMVGSHPHYPLPLEIRCPEDVSPYYQALNWSNPWGAGSHVSHQMFMLTVNNKVFGSVKNYDSIVDKMLEELKHYFDKKTGTWYKGSPTPMNKINGAMKILTGLQWLPRPYHDTRTLLEYALMQPFEMNGCGFIDRLFVVSEASKGVQDNYRRQEINSLISQIPKALSGFKKNDGAFSFYPNGSQTNYYGARVSSGRRESDLHGTALLVWAIAIALQLLDEGSQSTSISWKAHKA